MKEKQELKYQLKILPVLHTGAKANISWCVNRLGLLRNIVFLKVMTQSARKSSGKKSLQYSQKKLHRQLNLDFRISCMQEDILLYQASLIFYVLWHQTDLFYALCSLLRSPPISDPNSPIELRHLLLSPSFFKSKTHRLLYYIHLYTKHKLLRSSLEPFRILALDLLG